MKILIATLTLLLSYLFAANPTFAYTVKQGDTLTKIASENNLTLQELVEANPQIQNPNIIFIGDTVHTEGQMKTADSTETVITLNPDMNLLPKLIRVEAQSEKFAELYSQIQNPFVSKMVNTLDPIKSIQSYEIANYIVNETDLMTNFVREEEQSQELVAVTPPQNLKVDEPVAKEEEISTVSASNISNYSEYEIDLLARLVRAEAQTEPFEGKVAVACVVLNRVENPNFPDTIKEVIYERRQFQPVSNGEINEPADLESIEAVKAALTEQRNLVPDSLFFYNPEIATSRWLDSRTTTVAIGQHVFKK